MKPHPVVSPSLNAQASGPVPRDGRGRPHHLAGWAGLALSMGLLLLPVALRAQAMAPAAAASHALPGPATEAADAAEPPRRIVPRGRVMPVAAGASGSGTAAPRIGEFPRAQQPRTPITRTGPGGAEAMADAPASGPAWELGRGIYLEGRGEGGKPIRGTRLGGVITEGKSLACVNCHRRSGLGAVEGTELVLPVAGRIIFTDDPRAVVNMSFRTNKNFNPRHAPLDEAGLAAAIVHGRHVEGRELSPIMPRYDFSATELTGLQAYLRTLSARWSPGVTATRLSLATVVTPDVSPARRDAFVQTLKAAISQKNGNYAPGQRTMSSAAEMLFRTERFWEHEVWELSGAPETWAAQLDARLAAKPVFALVSGLGGGQWEPV
ncbi:MAG: hypothetical protein RL722_1399, partial [Pseudomonadota bacterium]